MLNYNLTIEEYIEMIQKTEFAMEHYEYVDFPEFEKIVTYGYGIATVFEDLAEKLGRIPTQQEFIKEGLARCKAFFVDPNKVKQGGRWLTVGKYDDGSPIWYHFKWDKKLISAATSRLARSYPSFVVEYSTILMIKSKFPEYEVGVNDYLDGIAGVDICIGSEEQDKMLYVHITNGSDYSQYWLERKESRTGKGWDKKGKKYEYKRNFKKGHLHLTFTHYDSVSTQYINGMPMIKEEHLRNVLGMAFSKSLYMDSFKEQEQLKDLDNWLISNDINENGLCFSWL